jgi:hypothetical protein
MRLKSRAVRAALPPSIVFWQGMLIRRTIQLYLSPELRAAMGRSRAASPNSQPWHKWRAAEAGRLEKRLRQHAQEKPKTLM